MAVSKNRGCLPPKWMVKIWENPYFLMDDLGDKKNPFFWKHPYHPFLFLLVCRARLLVRFFSNSVICTNPPSRKTLQGHGVLCHLRCTKLHRKGASSGGKTGTKKTPPALLRETNGFSLRDPGDFLGVNVALGGLGTLRFP